MRKELSYGSVLDARGGFINPGYTSSYEMAKQVSEEYCGTTYAARVLGLSVATVQALVESGELQAWKTSGGHRRISLRSLASFMRQQGVEPQPTAVQERRLRVLAVDDDEAMREVYRGHFEAWDLPLDFTIMGSAMEALIDISSINPDVLVADLRMPSVDGFEMIRKLSASASHHGMAIVAVTGLSLAEIAERGGLPASVVCRFKPLDMSWLQGFLAGFLAGETRARETGSGVVRT